jgi:hypothetical protein
VRLLAATPEGACTGVTKHEKHDDKDKYTGNGHDPNRPIPPEDAGGKHGKPDEQGNDDPDEADEAA